MMIKSLLKISLFVKRVLFLAVLGQFCFSAQAQGVVSKWKGVDPSNLDPTTTVYLFNVGTGKFVIHGNRWGTQATLRFPDLGTGFKVTKNEKGTYLFDSEISNSSEYKTGNYLSLVLKGHGSDSDNRLDWGYYMDRNADYRFTLKRVARTADNMYVYKLSQTLGSTTYYMTANADGTTIDYSTTEPTGAAGYWVLVTKQALIENLKEGLLADAFGQLNADATYLLGDQNFSINNTDFNKWKQVSTGESGTDYRYDWRNSRVTTDCWNKLVVTKEWGGDNDKDKATNAMYSNVSIEGQGLFAYSDITAPATGWYVIQCQGFYAGENPAYMYAKVVRNDKPDSVKLQDASSDFPLETSGSIRTRNASKGLKAGKAFYENSSNYLNELYFYAHADDNITIGISKPKAKKSGVDYSSNYYHDLDYVAVDNFQLKFFGVSPVVFIDDKDNLDYLNKQNSVTENVTNASTMLKRNMTLDQWNTLVLPVDMSSAQLKTAFGDSPNMVQLAKLTALNGTVLEFTSVDLSEDKPQALKADSIYIIKPQQSPVANSVTVNRADGTAVTVDGPFYNIGRHSYDGLNPKDLSVTVSSTVGVMTAHGTYVNTKCPPGSYVLSRGDMFHIKTATPVKGFRCWFTFDDKAPKNVSLAIDGIAEGALPTGLEDLVDTRLQPSDIYNANGQLVRRGATTLDGLPKGVYIVNGKKIAVQ